MTSQPVEGTWIRTSGYGHFGAEWVKDNTYWLQLVFDYVRTAVLKLGPNKCHFLKREVTFLGHVVLSDGIKDDLDKIKAIKNMASTT